MANGISGTVCATSNPAHRAYTHLEVYGSGCLWHIDIGGTVVCEIDGENFYINSTSYDNKYSGPYFLRFENHIKITADTSSASLRDILYILD